MNETFSRETRKQIEERLVQGFGLLTEAGPSLLDTCPGLRQGSLFFYLSYPVPPSPQLTHTTSPCLFSLMPLSDLSGLALA